MTSVIFRPGNSSVTFTPRDNYLSIINKSSRFENNALDPKAIVNYLIHSKYIQPLNEVAWRN